MIHTIKNHSTKKHISFLLFSLINILFAVKYFSRYTSYYVWMVAILCIFHTLLFYKGKKLLRFICRKDTFIGILWLVFFCIGCIFVWEKIPVESLNVDRWSVITSFWNNYFSDQYVYYAQSHLGNYPGPMPFYFILALPFYLIGELGFLSLAGILVFYGLIKYMKIVSPYPVLFILLITTSPFYLWEVLVRSNIFLNAVLIACSLILFFKMENYASLKNQLFIGGIIGLLLSTRNVFALCYIIFFLHTIRTGQLSLKSAIRIGAISVLVFISTFLPFVIGFRDDFLQMNPFIIQSSFLMPFGWVVTAILCSCFMFLFCKQNADVFFYSGVILFITIMLHFVYHALSTSVYISLIQESSIDVSYFILCIPFFLCYLLYEQSDQPNICMESHLSSAK